LTGAATFLPSQDRRRPAVRAPAAGLPGVHGANADRIGPRPGDHHAGIRPDLAWADGKITPSPGELVSVPLPNGEALVGLRCGEAEAE
jgi:hypothetical protein